MRTAPRSATPRRNARRRSARRADAGRRRLPTVEFADITVVKHVPSAAGRSCWGILNGPATGLALSELILDGAAAAVDLAPFRPDRRP